MKKCPLLETDYLLKIEEEATRETKGAVVAAQAALLSTLTAEQRQLYVAIAETMCHEMALIQHATIRRIVCPKCLSRGKRADCPA